MACGCRNASRVNNDGVKFSAPAGGAPQYVTAPTEVCLLCADKHVSVAYEEAMLSARPWLVLGELELARRHLAGLEDALSVQAAETVYGSAAAAAGWRDLISGLSDAVCARLLTAEGQAENKASAGFSTGQQPADVNNQLLGVIHLGAACRMARELGYMPKNRAMIIGDLVAAAEHLVRHDNTLGSRIRELRHSVQTANRADLSSQWIDVCERAVSSLPAWGSDEHAELLPGVRAYLGLPPA